jgi:hypothetical protein
MLESGLFLEPRRAIMNVSQRKPENRGGGFLSMRSMSLVCLLLLAVFMLVQVAHTHPFATDADHCPICVVMHSAAPVAVVAAILVRTQAASPVPAPVVHSVVRPWHFELFNRPPPSQG